MNPDTSNKSTLESASVVPPENVTVTSAHPVNQVTTFSKYFALALFIILPFVGGYVGYEMGEGGNVVNVYSVTNLQKDIEKNQISNDELIKKDIRNEVVTTNDDCQNQGLTFESLKNLEVGAIIAGLKFEGVTKNIVGTEVASFGGSFKIEGNITSNAMDKYFSVKNVRGDLRCLFKISEVDGNDNGTFPMLVKNLDQLPEYNDVSFDDGTFSSGINIFVKDLKIYDPDTSNWYLEANFVSVFD